MQAEMTAAVAAESDDRDRLLRTRRIGKRALQNRVELVGEVFDRRAAPVAGQCLGGQLAPRRLERGEQRARKPVVVVCIPA